MTNPPTPIGLAIVICDQIIEDKLTGKKSLIGIFNQIGNAEFSLPSSANLCVRLGHGWPRAVRRKVADCPRCERTCRGGDQRQH